VLVILSFSRAQNPWQVVWGISEIQKRGFAGAIAQMGKSGSEGL
jgi:hypothetical protein